METQECHQRKLNENLVYRRIWELSSELQFGNDRLIIDRADPREVVPNRKYEWKLYCEGDFVETIILDIGLSQVLQIDEEVQFELRRAPRSK